MMTCRPFIRTPSSTLPPSFAATIIGGQIVMAEEEAIGVPSGKPIDFLSRTQPAEPDGV